MPRRQHVLDALRAAESLLRERQILGYADDGESARGGTLVEGAHTGGTHRCVDGRKDVEQKRFSTELLAADRAEVGADQRKAGRR